MATIEADRPLIALVHMIADVIHRRCWLHAELFVANTTSQGNEKMKTWGESYLCTGTQYLFLIVRSASYLKYSPVEPTNITHEQQSCTSNKKNQKKEHMHHENLLPTLRSRHSSNRLPHGSGLLNNRQ